MSCNRLGASEALTSPPCLRNRACFLFLTTYLLHPTYHVVLRSFVMYFLEHQAQMGERAIVIWDMAGWKFSYALQLRKTGALIKTLQEHYPERLEAALLFHTPGIFNAAWKLIRPMVDPVTAAKVEFVPSGGERAALEARGVPSKLMPKPYGGPLEVNNVPVPNIPGVPNVTVVTRD